LENKPIPVQDIFEPDVSFVIEEASGEVDGIHILAKISGTFFVPDGISRNKRHYSESLWKKQLARKEIKELLESRRMFGTISHEQELNDKALLEGKVSHIITKLSINEKDGKKQGYGEALILNTPAGQLLNTYYRAGSKLFTSSRAGGTFKGTHSGIPSVDEDTYRLKTFDFIGDPGFLEANPDLVESYNEIFKPKLNENSNEEENDMDKEMTDLLSKSMNENSTLQADLKNTLNEVETLKGNNTVLTEENTHIKGEIENLKKINENIKVYEELGKADELKEKLAKNEELLKKFENLGTPEAIGKVFEECKTKVTSLEEELNNFKKIGTFEEIQNVFEKSKEEIGKYRPLGTPEEIEETNNEIVTVIDDMKKSKNSVRIKALAEELKIPEEKIEKIYETMKDEEEIKEFFKDLSESSKIKKKFQKTNEDVNGDNKDGNTEDENPFANKTSAESLMEQFN